MKYRSEIKEYEEKHDIFDIDLENYYINVRLRHNYKDMPLEEINEITEYNILHFAPPGVQLSDHFPQNIQRKSERLNPLSPIRDGIMYID